MSKTKPAGRAGAARTNRTKRGDDGDARPAATADPADRAAVQAPPPEQIYAAELAFLARWDDGPRPPSWKLTPRAVVTFIVGSEDVLRAGGTTMLVGEKFVGDRSLVERCVVTLAGERGLLLVGEPGTAKSMLSELLAAAIG